MMVRFRNTRPSTVPAPGLGASEISAYAIFVHLRNKRRLREKAKLDTWEAEGGHLAEAEAPRS